MTKKNGLGELAKGLDWIGKKKSADVIPAATAEQLSSAAVSPEPKNVNNAPGVMLAVNQDAIKFEQNMPLNVENDPVKYSELMEQYRRCTEEIRALQIPLLEMSLMSKEKPAKKLRKVKSSVLGLEAGFTRTTLIVREEHLKKFKQLSQEHQASVKDLLDLAISRFFKTL